MPDWIKLGVPILTLVVSAFVAYYVRQTQKDTSRLEGKQDAHEKKDDDRFEKLAIKVDGIKGNELLYEKLDTLKEDIVTKRHALRAEMRDAFAAQYERSEKMEERLRAEIARIENQK